MAKAKGLTKAEREYYLRRLVSCPDCGVICVVAWVFGDGSGVELEDVNPAVEERVREVLGDDQVDRQGIGVNGPWFHCCPPTRSRLVAVESGEELVHELHVL